jgi:hypothetical protein
LRPLAVIPEVIDYRAINKALPRLNAQKVPLFHIAYFIENLDHSSNILVS